MLDEQNTPEVPLETEYEKWSKLPEGTEHAASSAAEPETAPDAETAPASEPDDTTVDKGKEQELAEEKLPKGLKKRFRELTGQIRDLQTQLASKPAAREATPGAASPPSDTKAAAGEPVEPKLADFADYPLYEVAFTKYVKDLTQFAAKQMREQERQEAEQASRRQAEQKSAEKWTEQVEAASDEHDDYESVALNDNMPVTPVMFAVLQASENGAEVLYHLGSDFNAKGDLAKKIAGMSGPAAALALGKLEAKLFPEQSTETKKPAVSRAPRPPKPVGAGGAGADLGKEPDPKDFNAWAKWKDRQEAAEAA